MEPNLRTAFEHYLVTGQIASELSYEQLGPLIVEAVQAASAVVGERDMLYLERDEFNVAAALTEMANVMGDRSSELRPDLDGEKINAWVDALPPNASREEQERLYRKIVLGEED